MDQTEVVQLGNMLTGKFELNCKFEKLMSPEYLIGGLTLFQVRVATCRKMKTVNNYGRYISILYIRFTKAHQSDRMSYSLNFKSPELGIEEKVYLSDDSGWRCVYEYEYSSLESLALAFVVTAHVDAVEDCSPFAALYEDDDLTDFELRGEGKGVRFHRAVLAAHSQVLRGMLAGEWREATEGSAAVSQPPETLVLLKQYLYLRRLPDNAADLEALAALASYYMIEDLEYRCCIKLMNTLTAQNACDVLQFATKHNLKLLIAAILESVQRGTIKAQDIMANIFK